ncbi:MAG: response regulator transcription factor [Clostridia bacterium]|nr:response regulator transcription factor [Clostridia bacterium]
MFHILLAEDDANLRHVIEKSLKNAGYTVFAAADGRAAYRQFCAERFDLVITDIMMPFMDGNELTAEIRKLSEDTPVLMLTALETIDDKERGFGSGADDYLVKPFVLKELILRTKALLRRYQSVSERKISLPHTELNFNTNTAMINGRKVELTKKEFLLLFKLLSHPNIIFSREQLIDEIWGFDSESSDRTVDTHIKWLRDKAENEDFKIVTVRGLGYKAVLQ